MKCTCGKPVRFDRAVACHLCWKLVPEELRRAFYRRIRGDLGDARAAVRLVREYLRLTFRMGVVGKSVIGSRNKYRKEDAQREIDQLDGQRKVLVIEAVGAKEAA